MNIETLLKEEMEKHVGRFLEMGEVTACQVVVGRSESMHQWLGFFVCLLDGIREATTNLLVDDRELLMNKPHLWPDLIRSRIEDSIQNFRDFLEREGVKPKTWLQQKFDIIAAQEGKPHVDFPLDDESPHCATCGKEIVAGVAWAKSRTDMTAYCSPECCKRDEVKPDVVTG